MLKSLFFLWGLLTSVLLFHSAQAQSSYTPYKASPTLMTPSSKSTSPSASGVYTKSSAQPARMPQTENPIIQHLDKQCEEAKKIAEFCGLIAQEKANENCEAEKKRFSEKLKNHNEAILSNSELESFNKGKAEGRIEGREEGRVEMKNRGKIGLVLTTIEGVTCEQMCSGIKNDKGLSLTCIASIDISCPSASLSSCNRSGEDVQCICI